MAIGPTISRRLTVELLFLGKSRVAVFDSICPRETPEIAVRLPAVRERATRRLE